MNRIISIKSSIAVCAFLLCTGAGAQTPPPQQIHVLTLLGRPIQFVVADKQGLVAKYGVEVLNDNKKNSPFHQWVFFLFPLLAKIFGFQKHVAPHLLSFSNLSAA